MIPSHGFVLPPFASWAPEEFRAKRDLAEHVITARYRWDITD
ncbi:D-lyxose/D-mannose family sugar isomerase, partial [Ruegeria lacuscaerulensis]